MNTVSPPHLRIVILAAGFSSRLGQPKALARVRGLSLLRRILILAGCFSRASTLVVVPPRPARYRIEARGLKAQFVINANRARGLSSSVRSGLAAARYAPAVLLMPVDLTGLGHRDLARLLSRRRAAPRRVFARNTQGRAGTPLILPRGMYGKASQIGGDTGLRDWASRLTAEQCVLVELPSAAADIDTPSDLRDARRRLRETAFRP